MLNWLARTEGFGARFVRMGYNVEVGIAALSSSRDVHDIHDIHDVKIVLLYARILLVLRWEPFYNLNIWTAKGDFRRMKTETQGYVSVTTLSTAANFVMNRQEAFTHTFRTYIRVREHGQLHLKFWHSNAVDSTWDQGQDACGGELGGSWRIDAAYVADGGAEPDGGVVAGTEAAVNFQGQMSCDVAPGELFWSDEAVVEIPEGHYLAFTWTITVLGAGKSIPYNTETLLASAYDAPGQLAAQAAGVGFKLSDRMQVLPSFIGYKKNVEKRFVFLGDSITQGVRTVQDKYEYWAARIGEQLGATYGIWNIGSGWGRAYDVAENGAWLHKAKQADEILIVLGVNDLDIGNRTADELLLDLGSIVAMLKEANPAMKIILGTVPPFNFEQQKELAWRRVNHVIRTTPPIGVDRVFDIAAVLSEPEPNEQRIRPVYMSGEYDPHPNGDAGAAVASAFLNWYL